MSRKLVMLNLLLAALLAAAGWQIHTRWKEAGGRAEQLRRTRVGASLAGEAPKIEGVGAVQAASYADVAMKMLFARDRNPNVVIEDAPKVEEPLPPFPVAYGVLVFGDMTTAFLSEKAGGTQKGYRVNDQVGPFKVAKLSKDEIVLEWKDKKFVKTIAELKAKETAPAGADGGAPPAEEPPAKKLSENGSVMIDHPVTKEEEFKEMQKKASGSNPWIDTGGTNHACAPGDSTPVGTVMNGYRKVTRPSMFGQACFWEPAR
ncbi:MAG: hypothetical protein R2729_18725 [Bryobacteraceae bacterium]